MTETLFDQALLGLEGRARGSACTTRCAPGCEATCHERCRKPGARHLHDQYYCDQIRLGRDVSEYRPDIRADWSDFLATLPQASTPAEQAQRALAVSAYAAERRARRRPVR